MLSVTGLSHAFGPTVALQGVDFSALPGRVLAVVGENGSGKSTLLKILAGELRPRSGTVSWQGKPLGFPSPVLLVHQELALCPDLTAAENVFLGLKRGPRYSASELQAKAQEILTGMGFPEINPSQVTRSLSVSQRQVLEIARSEARNAPVILLDEPTSSLTEADKAKLYTLIHRLKERGRVILFVSHFLEEVREVADDLLILRDGERVATGELSAFSDAEIVHHMVGRSVDDFFPRSEHPRGEPLLTLSHMTGQNHTPRNVSLEVCRGEVVGVTGLNGAGRTELLRTIFGLRRVVSGAIKVKQLPHLSPHAHWKSRTGFVSEERKLDGLAVDLSIAENLTMPTRSGLLSSPNRAAKASLPWIGVLGVKCHDPRQPVSSLSGGNQQKVAFGRLLHADCDLLLLDEPTRGIDVGSKIELYRQIDAAALRGCAVLMTSSYLPELLGVCDRIAVMNRGTLAGVHDARTVQATTLMKESIA